MDEFVQAVLNFTRGSPEQRILAEKYLISKEKSPQFYPVAVQILQYVPEQQNLLVDKNFLYFYAIKVIETVTRDQATFSHEARTDTVNFLLSWAEKQPPGIAMKKAVQVAVVLAISNEMFFPAFYPQTVLSLASHNSISAKISSLLFINELNLNLFDKGPNSNLLDLSEKVKKSFNEHMDKIVEFIYSMLVYTEVTKDVLEIFMSMIPWINIKYSTNDVFVTKLYNYLSVPTLLTTVLDVLGEIVSKWMGGTEKLKLIKKLNLPSVLGKVQISTNEQFRVLVKFLGTCLTEIVLAVERDFPVNSILYGKSTLNQMDFLEIHKIVVDHFLLYVLLFEKGEIENSMEFSSVITKIINSYFSDYSPITQQITQNSNDSVKIGIAGIYRGLFSSYKNVLKDSVDDDDAANVEKSLAAIYRAAASIDEQATILLQFLGEMLKVNECNCSVESVTCHSYFLLQFPDLLMNEENIKNVIVDNVNKFYIKALQVGTTVGTKCPVIPALTRFFMYLPVQSVMQIIDFCVQLAAHRKMVEEVKEALLEFRKLKDAVQPLQQWAVEMVKTTLVIDDTEWNTKKLSEHQDVYTIIGCVTSPQLLGDVIASLFLPQINKCNLAFTQPDVYFSTAYIGSRLSFCSTFLKTNLFFNKTEISKLFEGFCPVMLKIVNSEVPIIKEGIKKSIIEFLNVWVLALGDNFSVVPPLRAILGWFGTEAVDAMIVGSSVLQMVTKQEKIKSVIVNDEYCGVVQYFINSLSGIEHLNLGSELLHEKVETMGMVFKMINLPKSVVVVLNGIDFTTFISSVMVSIEKLNCFELAKQLSGYIVRSITLFIESNGVIGKNVGMNVWLMLFARLVLKTKNTKNFGMNMAVAECFRGILKVCVECNGFSKVLEQFVVSGVLGEQQQNFVVILQRVFALHPEQITTSKVMNILKV